MDNHNVTVEQWEYFNNRLDQFRDKLLETGRPFCDSRVTRLVGTLASIPGVTTVWSCSGHTKEERDIASPRTRGYVVFVTRGADVGVLLDVISEWIMEYGPDTWPTLEMIRLKNSGLGGEFYPAYSINLIDTPDEAGVLRIEAAFNALADKLVRLLEAS